VRVLGLKPGHDGAIALIDGGQLAYSVEGEKDSFNRNSVVTPSLVMTAGGLAGELPDVVAIGGWNKDRRSSSSLIGAGYDGADGFQVSAGTFFGRDVSVFSSSHERSHIFMAAGLMPGGPVEEGVVLVWEGYTGSFYRWHQYGRTIEPVPVLSQPGGRYAALFAIADPTFPDDAGKPRLTDAGKLMALAAYDQDQEPTPGEIEVAERLLGMESVYPLDKTGFAESPIYNNGVHTAPVHRAARYLTDRLFEIFLKKAKSEFPTPLPLMISGGCGLNCDWNSRWVHSKIFERVFVPPCTNDSGSALGTAIDALYQLDRPRAIDWSVYAGAPFNYDVEPDERTWTRTEVSRQAVAQRIADGAVVAWVSGRYEIGPRALGNRSLLAAPFTASTRERLNEIKGREEYRPIAPCCATERLAEYFDSPVNDPYMLYFNKVRVPGLDAITHADGSARVQSVSDEDNPQLYALLKSFEQVTGYAVLCNTSLNFRGAGFVNSMSDLMTYCEDRGIDEVVVEDRWYRRRHP
jgi:hydroxymethyl cephem carbamoyltransferase